MSPPSLYVCKAARRPRYRHENLHLLAAERGRVVEASYNPMWVATELLDDGAIPRGTPVTILLTDRPYTHFVPVRQGEVLEVERDELLVRLRILLHGWIAAPDGDIDAFTRFVRESSPAEAPGQKFMFRKRDDIVFERFFDGREDEGWRRAVDAVLAMSGESGDDPYRSSVFFRPIGVRVDDELQEARRLPLDPGAQAALALRFYNPHLSEDTVSRLALRVLTSDDARAQVPEYFPLAGDVEIPFEAIGSRPELTVEIGPTPVDHTAVTERFRAGEGAAGELPGTRTRRRTRVTDAPTHVLTAHTVEAEHEGIPTSVASQTTLRRDELLRLHDVVFRNAQFEPRGALDILDVFQQLLPDEPRVAERRALLLDQGGDEDEAYRILQALDPDRLGDDARFLLFRAALQRERAAGVVQRVASLDLASEGRFPRLLEALDAAPSPTLGRLLPDLIDQLAPDQLRDLVRRLGHRIETGDAAARMAVALFIATDDAAWAYTWLDERRRALRLADHAVTDALLELAEAGGRVGDTEELGEDAARRIGNLIERGESDEARALLRKAAGALGRGRRDVLYHRIADRLSDRGEFAGAAEVMVELAWAACGTGDLAEATEAVQRARGQWARERAGAAARARTGGRKGTGGNSGMVQARVDSGDSTDSDEPQWLRQAIQHVEAAWNACAELVEWRQTEEERLRERLRERYLNHRILIAGGFRRQEWVEQIEGLTGAKVDWAERYRDEGNDLAAFAQRIRNGHYAVVVHLWQKSGHEVGDRLKMACEEAGVPWVYARSAGVRGVVEGLSC